MLILVSFSISSRVLTDKEYDKDLLKQPCSFYIKHFSKYKCVKEKSIGRVGGTLVFQIQTSKKRRYALKVQARSKTSVKEADILKELSGKPYIIKLLNEFVNDDLHLLVLEYAPRKSLEIVLQTSDHFSSMENILVFFEQLIQGIRTIHQQGYVHAKICLENIAITENYEPRIIDFDSAEKIGTSTYFKGIPVYMSPELVKALNQKEKIKYESPIDIFAAGIVFYYIKMHHFPLSNYHMEYMQMINAPIEFEEGESTIFMSVINKVLQLKKERYSDDKLIDFLQKNIEHFDDPPLLSNYYYTMDENDLRIYKSVISNINYWTVCILVAAVVIFSLSLMFCYFQVCLFMIWSKTDKNRVSLPPSERQINHRFLDSTTASKIKQPVQSMTVSNQ
jgi:serine/threonine protein kinase